METIHSRPSWYAGKKKPTLQIKILQEILIHGKLSKIEFEHLYEGTHFHADIVTGFDNLKENELIEESERHPHRGRMEIFYTLSTTGLLALFSENPNPNYFWTSLVLWVYYQKNPIRWHDILELFDQYLKRYLKHYLKYGYYSLQLDEFNRTCNTWFEKAILRGTKIPPAQKVLEVLATNPDLTLEQVSRATQEKVSTIQSIIGMYTAIPHKPVLVDLHGHHDSPFYPTGWRLQIHNSIVQSPTKETYRLTVFGILMVLHIILKNHEGKLPHGLMNNNTIQQYIDKIASNYKSKIPLLFEKWQFLTSYLKEYSYLNFKIILDRNLREKAFDGSVIDGGNKELYFGMRETVSASQKQLIDLQFAGINVVFNFQAPQGTNNSYEDAQKKIQLCFHLFLYLTTIINPTDYDRESFISEYGNEKYLGSGLAEEIGSKYDIGHLEKSLSFEISFIYYLSLRSMLFSYDKFSPEYFKEIFRKIAMSDKEIGEFIYEHLSRIQNHYLEVQRTIGTMYQ